MREVDLSICICTHNDRNYINRAIDSALKQGENVEIVIVDDGSDDGTGQICDRYKDDSRFKIIHSSWRGLVAARNMSLQYVTGRYVTFLDADDWLEANMFVEAIKRLDNDDCVDVYVFAMKRNYSNGTEKYVIPPQNDSFFSHNDAINNLFTWNYYRWELCGKLYRQSLFFDDKMDESVTVYEDLDRNGVLFDRARGVYYSAKKAYHYYVNDTSMTRTIKNNNKAIEVFRRIVKKQWNLSQEARDLLFSNYLNLLIYNIMDNSYIYSERLHSIMLRDKQYLSELLKSDWNQTDGDKIRIKEIIPYLNDNDVVWEWYKSWSDIVDNLSGNEYVYGAGTVARYFMGLVKRKEKTIAGMFVTKDVGVNNCGGYQIETYDKNQKEPKTIILCMNEDNQKEVVKYIDNYKNNYIMLECKGLF